MMIFIVLNNSFLTNGESLQKITTIFSDCSKYSIFRTIKKYKRICGHLLYKFQSFKALPVIIVLGVGERLDSEVRGLVDPVMGDSDAGDGPGGCGADGLDLVLDDGGG